MTSPFQSLSKPRISPSPYKSVLPLRFCLGVQHTVNNHTGARRLVLWYTGDPYWRQVDSDSVTWCSEQLLRNRLLLGSSGSRRAEREATGTFCILINPFVEASVWGLTALCVCMKTSLNKRRNKGQGKQYVTPVTLGQPVFNEQSTIRRKAAQRLGTCVWIKMYPGISQGPVSPRSVVKHEFYLPNFKNNNFFC